MTIHRINNRYTLLKMLGTGSMGEIFLAEDTLYDNDTIAVKIIKPDMINEHNVSRFKKEFEVMTCLRHPNLIKVHDFGKDESSGDYFIVMEYLDGTILSDYIEHVTLDFNDVIDIIVQLLRALDFVHSRNIIHRDIKPDNIIIGTHGLKLMDFGLADLGEVDNKPKGTLMYLAPEILIKKIDWRVDLYAVGIVFYQLLTNTLFYKKGNASCIINTIQEQDIYCSYLQKKLDDIKHKELQGILRIMLNYHPDKRFQKGSQIIHAINRALHENHPIETDETRKAYVLGAGFVSRMNELKALIHNLESDSDDIVIVRGEVGVGKSRLMSEFKKYCQLHDVTFLESNCFNQVSGLFIPLRPIIKECLLIDNENIIEEFGPDLKKLFPNHNRLQHIRINRVFDPKIERELLVHAILGIIIAFTERIGHTIVMYINDIQWCDEASFDVIQKLNNRIRSVKKEKTSFPNFIMYLSCREDSFDDVKSTLIYNRFKDIKIRPFIEEEVEDYIYSTFGKNEVGQALQKSISSIRKKVGGNPFYLQELITSFVLQGYIEHHPEEWELTTTIEDLHIPHHLNTLVELRLESLELSQQEMKLLYLLALIDREISWEEFNHISPVNVSFLVMLESQQILKTRVYENKLLVTFLHDLIKSTVISQIKKPQPLHGLIAVQLEHIHKDNLEKYVDDLAHHYYYMGNHEKARFYLIKAGDNAAHYYYNKKAITFYQKALELVSDKDLELKLDILFKLNEPLRIVSHIDNYLHNVDEVLAMLQKIPNIEYEAQIYMNFGRYYLFLPDVKKAMHYLNMALKLFEKLDDKKGITSIYIHLGFEYQLLNDYTTSQKYLEDALKISDEINYTYGIARASATLSYIMMDFGKFEEAKSYILTALDHSIKYNLKEMEHLQYSNLGELYMHMGEYDTSIVYYDRALVLANEIDSPMNWVSTATDKVRVLFLAGLIEEAEKLNNECEIILKELDMPGTYFYFAMMKAQILDKKGETKLAVEILECLLNKQEREERIARINFILFEMTKQFEYRDIALILYKKLYNLIPKIFYKEYIDILEKSLI